MEQEITDLGKEIARLERQEAFERELSQPVNQPLTGRPASCGAGNDNALISPAVCAAGAVYSGSGSFDHRDGERHVCGEPER